MSTCLHGIYEKMVSDTFPASEDGCIQHQGLKIGDIRAISGIYKGENRKI